jgi:transketolase
VSFTEDVCARYEAYNWHVQIVADVNDLASLRAAIDEAKSVTDRPSMIKIRTVIGVGRLTRCSRP